MSESGATAQPREWWVKRSWTRLWWVAIDPHETLCDLDTSTYYRAWTRERLIAKLASFRKPRRSAWEDIHV